MIADHPIWLSYQKTFTTVVKPEPASPRPSFKPAPIGAKVYCERHPIHVKRIVGPYCAAQTDEEWAAAQAKDAPLDQVEPELADLNWCREHGMELPCVWCTTLVENAETFIRGGT